MLDVASGVNLTLGAIGGAYAITKQDTGTLTLNTTSTRIDSSGSTTLSGGTLRLGTANALNTATTTPVLTISGGKLSLGLDTGAAIGGAGNVTVTGTATIEVDRNSTGAGVTDSVNRISLGACTLNVTYGANVNNSTAGLTVSSGSTGAITLTASPAVLDVASGVTVTVATGGSLTGNSFNFTKQDGGTLILNGGSSRTGSANTLSAGTLQFGSTTALGDSSNTLQLNGGTLDLAIDSSVTAYNTTVGGTVTIASDKATASSSGITHTLGTLSIGANTLNVTRGANATSGTGGLAFGTATQTGAAVFDAGANTLLTLASLGDGGFSTTVQDSGNVTITGAITGGGALTKTGSGTLTISGNSSSVGAVSVSAGTLNLGYAGAANTCGKITISGTGIVTGANGNSALGATGVEVDTGGTLQVGPLTSGRTIAAPLTLNGTGASSGGALVVLATTANHALIWSGAITLASDSQINNQCTYGNDIASLNTGGITLAGHTLTLSGYFQVNDTISGSGGLTFGVDPVSGSYWAETVLIGAAASVTSVNILSGGEVQLGGNDRFTAASVTDNSIFDMNGYYETVVTLSGNGTVIDNTTGTGLTLSNPAGETFSGSIGGTLGNVTKNGSGTWTLSGANGYTGATVINNGTLALTGSGSLSSTLLNIAAGATFDVSAFDSPYNLSPVSAAGTASAATIKGAFGGVVNADSKAITLAYDGSHPALTISQGQLTLNQNAFTVNKAAALAVGTYNIVSVTGGTINSTPPYTVTGTAIGSGKAGSISVSGGNVVLTIQNTTGLTLTRTVGASPSDYGDALNFHAVVSPDPGASTITFKTNGTTCGTATTASGAADLPISTLQYSYGAAWTVTAEFAGNATYVGSTNTLAGGQQVNQTNLTVTAASDTKTYDGTTSSTATPTITTGGIQTGDTAPAWTQTYDNRNVGTSKTLTPASLVVSDGFGGNNYHYTYTPVTTGEIDQANLTVTAAANSKTYDGTTSATATPTITVGAIQTGDTAPTWTETYTDASVGSGKTLTPAGTISDGNTGLNYAYTYATVATGVITPAATGGGLAASPNPSLPGVDVTFTATLTNAVPGGPYLSGSVQFKTNAVPLCDPIALDGTGVATLVTNSLPHGSNAVSAEFAGPQLRPRHQQRRRGHQPAAHRRQHYRQHRRECQPGSLRRQAGPQGHRPGRRHPQRQRRRLHQRHRPQRQCRPRQRRRDHHLHPGDRLYRRRQL